MTAQAELLAGHYCLQRSVGCERLMALLTFFIQEVFMTIRPEKTFAR
jgi:hypothetical protein